MLSEGSLSVLGLILQPLPQDAVEFQNRLLNQGRVGPASPLISLQKENDKLSGWKVLCCNKKGLQLEVKLRNFCKNVTLLLLTLLAFIQAALWGSWFAFFIVGWDEMLILQKNILKFNIKNDSIIAKE